MCAPVQCFRLRVAFYSKSSWAGAGVEINKPSYLLCVQHLHCSTSSIQGCDGEENERQLLRVVVGESFVCLLRCMRLHIPQNKALLSAPTQSGSVTESQTALTALFNLTNNSLLTGAFSSLDLCICEHILPPQGERFSDFRFSINLLCAYNCLLADAVMVRLFADLLHYETCKWSTGGVIDAKGI